ncbi:hypothetical protein Cob_v003499 [Colletotrichum orbiculare MAFF 240422]|uniref:Uncharacterized protein n=1 Tax=Colletotrichum orbiculare (strain 104-T / ATCC 96160 / CBS 514.97 / LARS 414 / MAFF 240422) TaxID=1213857 RepID=A0A484G2L6_COLOR|nr:hypothetical protein Cob_v003499 [Colletotrichum orbiculare MAFF 240422]
MRFRNAEHADRLAQSDSQGIGTVVGTIGPLGTRSPQRPMLRTNKVGQGVSGVDRPPLCSVGVVLCVLVYSILSGSLTSPRESASSVHPPRRT